MENKVRFDDRTLSIKTLSTFTPVFTVSLIALFENNYRKNFIFAWQIRLTLLK